MPNQPPAQMTPEDAKASMGIATHLSSFLMPQGKTNTPAPQPPTNQETPTDTSNQIQGLEGRIFDELGTLKEEIKKAQPQTANKELQDLKDQLQAIIDGNDQN